MISPELINRFRINGVAVDLKHEAETRLALQQGIAILAREGFAKPGIKAIIWRLTQEAVETLRALPDRERAWLHSNERAIWPEIARPREECRAVEDQIRNETSIEALRYKSELIAKRFIPDPPPYAVITDPSAPDRMLVVLGWLRYVKSKNKSRDRRVFLDLASGRPPRIVKRKHFYYNCADSTVRMTKERVLQHIAVALLPYSNGLTFDGR